MQVFLRTIGLWNQLPSEVFTMNYNMGLFKRSCNRIKNLLCTSLYSNPDKYQCTFFNAWYVLSKFILNFTGIGEGESHQETWNKSKAMLKSRGVWGDLINSHTRMDISSHKKKKNILLLKKLKKYFFYTRETFLVTWVRLQTVKLTCKNGQTRNNYYKWYKYIVGLL